MTTKEASMYEPRVGDLIECCASGPAEVVGTSVRR